MQFENKGWRSIKTKVNHPYIYFYIEPNVVFVYKIEWSQYMTLQDLMEFEECESYELKEGETFNTFHHRERQALKGRGFFIKQDAMNKMVEIINQQIQRHRHLNDLTEHGDAVHIVSSEHAAGTVRYSLPWPKKVIGFPDFFSIGPLWKLEEKAGQAFRNEWIMENINLEQDDYEYENKFSNTLKEIEDIPKHVRIFIWYGNNVEEQTGMRFFLYLLREKTNEIVLINSTELFANYFGSAERFNSHTGHLEPETLKKLFEICKENDPVGDSKRMALQKEWEALSQSKEVLRIWKDDQIKAVPEIYYDEIILKTIENLHKEQESKDFIKTGAVIGEILEKMDEPVFAYYIEYRIRYLVYSGFLELKGIPRSMRHYSVKLCEK
ncbi:DUF1835 domain-containing protein [Bacillus benzoevorans]|uniref:DUF1835 domain-containing protein n=1 Tax=Bacillus benzoevorans TaxID=1456 RepID=A0A7X0HNP6_9BACI|nr:DUF1835 domain-containing protein [Bacillus benzoevorans]MBB6444048.1 hypothetical protein [Bacillus benzoevorans]